MNTRFAALEVLRQATSETHRQLENSLRITSQDAGRNEYLEHIVVLFGWLSSFEDALWSYPWPSDISTASRSNKCAWILQDFQEGGIRSRDIPLCPFSPNLSTLPHRIGLAYVIEGAQLGNRVLLKSLAPRLAPWSPRWLQSYGDKTSEQWREFLAFTENHLLSESDRTTAALAAKAGFMSLAAWFDECFGTSTTIGTPQFFTNPLVRIQN